MLLLNDFYWLWPVSPDETEGTHELTEQRELFANGSGEHGTERRERAKYPRLGVGQYTPKLANSAMPSPEACEQVNIAASCVLAADPRSTLPIWVQSPSDLSFV